MTKISTKWREQLEAAYVRYGKNWSTAWADLRLSMLPDEEKKAKDLGTALADNVFEALRVITTPGVCDKHLASAVSGCVGIAFAAGADWADTVRAKMSQGWLEAEEDTVIDEKPASGQAVNGDCFTGGIVTATMHTKPITEEWMGYFAEDDGSVCIVAVSHTNGTFAPSVHFVPRRYWRRFLTDMYVIALRMDPNPDHWRIETKYVHVTEAQPVKIAEETKVA